MLLEVQVPGENLACYAAGGRHRCGSWGWVDQWCLGSLRGFWPQLFP